MPAAVQQVEHAAGLEVLLCELESNELFVMLVPEKRRTCEGGMIRVAAARNATWYRRFCGNHLSSRRRRNRAPDTRIKRRDTIRLLNRLIAGAPTASKYAREIMEFARKADGRFQPF